MTKINFSAEILSMVSEIRTRADLRGYANAAHLHCIADSLEGLAELAAESDKQARVESGIQALTGWENPSDLGELGAAIDRLNGVAK